LLFFDLMDVDFFSVDRLNIGRSALPKTGAGEEKQKNKERWSI
jgi:hypothetical protein